MQTAHHCPAYGGLDPWCPARTCSVVFGQHAPANGSQAASAADVGSQDQLWLLRSGALVPHSYLRPQQGHQQRSFEALSTNVAGQSLFIRLSMVPPDILNRSTVAAGLRHRMFEASDTDHLRCKSMETERQQQPCGQFPGLGSRAVAQQQGWHCQSRCPAH